MFSWIWEPYGAKCTEKVCQTIVRKMNLRYALMEATRRRPKATDVYYSIKVDYPFRAMRHGKMGKLLTNQKNSEVVMEGLCILRARKHRLLQMKVAIYPSNTEQARLNMRSELPALGFDKVRLMPSMNGKVVGRTKFDVGPKKTTSPFLYTRSLGCFARPADYQSILMGNIVHMTERISACWTNTLECQWEKPNSTIIILFPLGAQWTIITYGGGAIWCIQESFRGIVKPIAHGCTMTVTGFHGGPYSGGNFTLS